MSSNRGEGTLKERMARIETGMDLVDKRLDEIALAAAPAILFVKCIQFGWKNRLRVAAALTLVLPPSFLFASCAYMRQ